MQKSKNVKIAADFVWGTFCSQDVPVSHGPYVGRRFGNEVWVMTLGEGFLVVDANGTVSGNMDVMIVYSIVFDHVKALRNWQGSALSHSELSQHEQAMAGDM